MITNTTRKKVLAQHHVVYSSLWKKGLGLMFRYRRPSYAVAFSFSSPERVSIHMWFVFFPLDILWLDENKKVQETRTLTPWSLFRPKHYSSYVIELPAGSIQKSGTIRGDVIQISGPQHI